MGIQISGGVTVPAVTFDHVHVTNMRIVQPTFTDDTQQPVYSIEVTYILYGVTTENVRYYDTAAHTVTIPDYVPLALTQAAGGDTRLIDALTSIQAAVSVILAEEEGFTTVVV